MDLGLDILVGGGSGNRNLAAMMPLSSSLINTRGAAGAYSSDSLTPKDGVMVEGPIFESDGLRLVGGYTQLYPTPTAPQNETISLPVGSHTLRCEGGSVSITAGTATITVAGTATDGNPHTFVVDTAGTVSFTVSGATRANLAQSGYPLPWIDSESIKATEAGNSDGTGVSWRFDEMSEKAWNCFRGKTDGVELAQSPEFENPGDWGASQGWSVAVGLATNVSAASAGSVYQQIGVVGVEYEVSFTVDSVEGSGVMVRFGSAFSSPVTSPGEYSVRGVQTVSTVIGVTVANGVDTTATVSRISIQKVLPAQGSLFVDWTPGFDAVDIAGPESLNIFSHYDLIVRGLYAYANGASSRLYFRTAADVDRSISLNWTGGTAYHIGVRWGELTEGLQQVQLSIDGTWSSAVVFTGWTLGDFLRLTYGNEELQWVKAIRVYNAAGELVGGKVFQAI